MTDQASSTQKPAQGDERNIVAVDPNAAQATLEERLALFWAQNRAFILGGIAVVILVIVGRAWWDSQRAAKERETVAAFGAAETVEAKMAFAREHADHALAGVALLAVADQAYADRDYASASTRYAAAAAALTDPVLAGRARLGQAIATLQSGGGDQGEQLLRSLGGDAAAPEAIRAEAWYHLAAHLNDAGNTSAAREALTQVQAVSPAGMWTMRAATLGARMAPETPGLPAGP